MNDQIKKYLNTWLESIGDVLGQLANEKVTACLIEGETAEAFFEGFQADGLWLRMSLSKALTGRQAFLFSNSDGARLAQLLTGEDGSEEGLTEERREGLEELLRQCGGSAVGALKATHRGEVTIKWDGEGELEGSALLTCMRFTWSAGTCVLGVALENSLLENFPDAPQDKATAAVAGIAAPAAAAKAAPAPPASTRNLDMLMDVTLDVTLRFGERELLLRDVIELSPGSVVELDKQVQEPAELLVTGRVVARGEVVIVDGNYGLRVTEVVSRAARVEFLS